MPVKYVGQITYQVGKTLWEILGNLKNFGVGRVIARGSFERYPEPSYIRICRVEAEPNENPRKVKVWGEKVFRGRKYDELAMIRSVSYKPDYKLIPKDEEESYCNFTSPPRNVLLPRTAHLPPLLRELIIRDMKSKGLPVKEPRMVLQYKQSIYNVARVAPEGSNPSFEIEFDVGKPVTPKLYENLQ